MEARITPADRLAVLERHAAGHSIRDIAAEMGLSKSAVGRAVKAGAYKAIIANLSPEEKAERRRTQAAARQRAARERKREQAAAETAAAEAERVARLKAAREQVAAKAAERAGHEAAHAEHHQRERMREMGLNEFGKPITRVLLAGNDGSLTYADGSDARVGSAVRYGERAKRRFSAGEERFLDDKEATRKQRADNIAEGFSDNGLVPFRIDDASGKVIETGNFDASDSGDVARRAKSTGLDPELLARAATDPKVRARLRAGVQKPEPVERPFVGDAAHFLGLDAER